MALTDTAIRRSKPAETPYKLFDGGGLHLLINPTGGRLWRWKYRFAGAEKLMALGRYPEVSLADARERRDAARKRLANGIDPMAERKAEKLKETTQAVGSFNSVAALWLEHWRDGKSARHADSVERRMKADILPCLGVRPIAEIEAPELVSMVTPPRRREGPRPRGARQGRGSRAAGR